MGDFWDEQEPDMTFYRQFFTEDLYLTKEAARTVQQTAQKADDGTVVLLSGNKQADVLLLFSYPGKDDIPGKDKNLLTLILTAVSLNLDKVAWLNTALYPDLEWHNILLLSPASKIIAFGLEPKRLPQDMTQGQIYSVQGRRVICGASLAVLENDKAQKTVLWRALKEIFGV